MANGTTHHCLQSCQSPKTGIWLLFWSKTTTQPSLMKAGNQQNKSKTLTIQSPSPMNFGSISRENSWKRYCHQMTCGGSIEGIWQWVARIFMAMSMMYKLNHFIFQGISPHGLQDMFCRFCWCIHFLPNDMTPDSLNPISLDSTFLQQHSHVCCSLWHHMLAEKPPLWLILTTHLDHMTEGWAAWPSKSSDMGTMWYYNTTSK